MNIKRAATKLVKLYEEAKDALPLIPLSNGAVGYKNYVIKQDSKGGWSVYTVNGRNLDFVDRFNLKSSACMAAKHYNNNNIMGDLLLIVKIKTPKTLSDKEKELLMALRQESNFNI